MEASFKQIVALAWSHCPPEKREMLLRDILNVARGLRGCDCEKIENSADALLSLVQSVNRKSAEFASLLTP